MYQNILNFLFGKTKKSLSKKEADDLIRLIAQSIGLEEEYKDKTDDKSFIKKMLDEVVIEENDFNLDEIFDFEEDSYEYPEDYEEIERVKPLSKRKIKRKSVFNKGDGDKVEDVKRDSEVEDKEEINQPSLSPNTFTLPPSQNTFTLPSSQNTFNLPPSQNTLTLPPSQPSFTLPPSQNTFTLPPSQNTFTLPPSQPSFSLPPSQPSKIEDNDFPFDLGQLESVKNTGPFYKFLDENGEDL